MNLIKGQVLHGVAALDLNSPYGPDFQYLAYVQVTDNNNGSYWLPLNVSNTDVPYGTSGPWQSWGWTAPHSGTFTLYYVAGGNYGGGGSNGLFDTQTGVPPVPEPGTCALLLMGLPGLMYFRRRRK